MASLLLLFLITCILACTQGWSDNKQRRFKDGFLFGAATSAYQVEGGWDADGKGESIWDTYFHQPGMNIIGHIGDEASDSYHQFRRDVEMLQELGVDFYRFSISWPRVLPTGFPNNINEKGLEYYDNLIDELLKHKIEPMITLYHFDLPQKLQDLGGWANPLIIQWFKEYAKVVFNRYAHKVKYWLTINQPNVCMESYGGKFSAPALSARGIGDYICVKNMMLSHAEVYRLYEKEFKKKYKGSVGIALSLNWSDPINNSTDNVEAAEVHREFNIGLYMDPIWSKHGDWPKVVKDIVAQRSKKEGYTNSRLPKLSKSEIELLKGSSDFLGMNYYTTFLIKSTPGSESPFALDQDIDMSHGEQWMASDSPWLKSAPYGLYKVCLFINQRYDYPIVWITESGWSEAASEDAGRTKHLSETLNALLLAIEDGTDVRGYTLWSLLDNVEWMATTTQRFGLYAVDFESSQKTRTPRHSAFFFKEVIKNRTVDVNWKPRRNMIMRPRKLRKIEL